MKTKIVFTALAAMTTLMSCQKNYTCECTTASGARTMFSTNDTRENARKKCNDYRTSDTLISRVTECKLK